MASDYEILELIKYAVSEAHNSPYGGLAKEDRIIIALEDRAVIAQAVFDALKQGGHLK